MVICFIFHKKIMNLNVEIYNKSAVKCHIKQVSFEKVIIQSDPELCIIMYTHTVWRTCVISSLTDLHRVLQGSFLRSLTAFRFRFLLKKFSSFPLFFSSLYFSANCSFFLSAEQMENREELKISLRNFKNIKI